MKADEVIDSKFIRRWVRYELDQYGVKERAAYVVNSEDPRYILVATNLGILELRTERGASGTGSDLRLNGVIRPWPEVGAVEVTTETQHDLDSGGFAARMSLKINALGLELEGSGTAHPGFEDFVREALRASVKQ